MVKQISGVLTVIFRVFIFMIFRLIFIPQTQPAIVLYFETLLHDGDV